MALRYTETSSRTQKLSLAPIVSWGFSLRVGRTPPRFIYNGGLACWEKVSALQRVKWVLIQLMLERLAQLVEHLTFTWGGFTGSKALYHVA